MRFAVAVDKVRGELLELQPSVPASAPAEMGAFLNLHLMILDDSTLSQAPRELIRTRRCNAEWALVQQMDHLVAQFEEIEDAYLRERKEDVVQVVERVLKAMLGTGPRRGAPAHEENLIVVAHDLSPADMILFKQHQFAGFVTDLGGVTSHTAIVARSLNIPAIVGLHHGAAADARRRAADRRRREGVLIVNPGRQVLAEYKQRQRELELERQKLKRLRTTPATTRDGTAVELQANIELPQDVEQVRESGATGIGLFRSEFLFLNRDDLPGEDEQFEAYRQVAEAMHGMPVTIRTLDLGADKTVNGGASGGPNPALGLRAIRFCLAEPQMFLTQLRAILRASNYGKIRLLIPMLAHAHEIEQALAADRQAQGVARRSEGCPTTASIEDRRHDRSAGGGAVARRVRAQARFPFDRHQRPDPVHAGHRPHRRHRGAPVRSAAPGGAAADRPDHPHRQAHADPGGGVRRNGGRPGADAAAARLRAAPVLHASGAAARDQAAGAADATSPGWSSSRTGSCASTTRKRRCSCSTSSTPELDAGRWQRHGAAGRRLTAPRLRGYLSSRADLMVSLRAPPVLHGPSEKQIRLKRGKPV